MRSEITTPSSDDWYETTWGELVELKYGKGLREYKDAIGKFPVYGTNGAVGWCDKPLCEFPSIIIGRKGAYRGVHYSDLPFYVIDTAYFTVPKKDINLKWAYYNLLTQDITGLDSGSAIPSTRREDFYHLPVRVPPLKVQDEIVSNLDSLNNKIAINRQINQTLESMAQTIFKSWFVDFEPVKAKIAALKAGKDAEGVTRASMRAISGKTDDELDRMQAEQPENYAQLKTTAGLFPAAMQDSELGEVPEGWEIMPFSKLANLDTTSVKPHNDPDKLWEHYSIPAFDVNEAPKFELGSEIKSNKYKVNPIAILSSKLNPNTPRTWWPDVDDETSAICSTEFMQFVPTDVAQRAFIFGLITSDIFQSGIKQRVTGSTGSRQRAQPRAVAEMDVIKPKEELVLAYCSRLTELYVLKAKNIKENITLANIRDALLPKLMSGDILVKAER